MDGAKSKEEGGGGTQEGRAELSREEVMAQRAAKKKLKEARKKGGGGGAAEASSGDNPGAVKIKPEVKKSQSQPPPQQQQQQPQQKERKQEKESSSESKNTKKKGDLPQERKEPEVTSKPSQRAPTKAKKEATPVPEEPVSKPKGAAPTPAEGSITSKSKTGGKVKKADPANKSSIQSLFLLKAADQVTSKDEIARLSSIFYKFGLKTRHNVIRGSNLRCVKLLEAVKEFVHDFSTPAGAQFKVAFSEQFKFNMRLLKKSCPFGIGMTNAVEFLSAFLLKLENVDVNQQKQEILEAIDTYIEEKIEKGVEAIVLYTVQKLTAGDVIMTYSITEAVLQAFIAATKQEIKFSVIFVLTPETMPDLQMLLAALAEPIKKNQVTVSTINFSNAIHRIRHCSKVLIGGHGLFTTGGVMALSGSGELALLASTYNKPTVFLCETYKFCDRSPLDFFTLDEYQHALSTNEEGLFEPKIKFDVTPANLVTVVITDIDVLPSTSVAGVLRVQETREAKNSSEHYH